MMVLLVLIAADLLSVRCLSSSVMTRSFSIFVQVHNKDIILSEL